MQFPVDSVLFNNTLKIENRGIIGGLSFHDHPVAIVSILGEYEAVDPTSNLAKSEKKTSSTHVHVFYVKDKKGKVPVVFNYTILTDRVMFNPCPCCKIQKLQLGSKEPIYIRVVGNPSVIQDAEKKSNIRTIKSQRFEIISSEQQSVRITHHLLSVKATPLRLAETVVDYDAASISTGKTPASASAESSGKNKAFADYTDPFLLRLQNVFEKHCMENGGILTSEQVYKYLEEKKQLDPDMTIEIVKEKLNFMGREYGAIFDTSDDPLNPVWSPIFPCD
jgi:hypothetical protein